MTLVGDSTLSLACFEYQPVLTRALGVTGLFDTLIAAIIARKDSIDKENELKKRDSVMLTSVPTPAWAAQAEAEEKAQMRKGSSWSCCQI